MWLVVQQKLLTKERLCKLGIACDNTTCGLCEDDAFEAIQHLFGDCSWSKPVWEEISNWSSLNIKHNGILRNILQITDKEEALEEIQEKNFDSNIWSICISYLDSQELKKNQKPHSTERYYSTVD